MTSPLNPPGADYDDAADGITTCDVQGGGSVRCSRLGDYTAAALSPDKQTVWIAGEYFLAGTANLATLRSNWYACLSFRCNLVRVGPYLHPSLLPHLRRRGTFITAVQLTPNALCQDVVLTATSNCAATPTLAELEAAINAGSTPGIGGALIFNLQPQPDQLNPLVYDLPGGQTYTFTLQVVPLSIYRSSSLNCLILMTASFAGDKQPGDQHLLCFC